MISGRIFSPSFRTRSPKVLAAICQQRAVGSPTSSVCKAQGTQRTRVLKLTGLTASPKSMFPGDAADTVKESQCWHLAHACDCSVWEAGAGL